MFVPESTIYKSKGAIRVAMRRLRRFPVIITENNPAEFLPALALVPPADVENAVVFYTIILCFSSIY